MHRAPKMANGASVRLGQVASGCGSKGRLLAQEMHGSNVEVREPVNGLGAADNGFVVHNPNIAVVHWCTIRTAIILAIEKTLMARRPLVWFGFSIRGYWDPATLPPCLRSV